MNDGRCYESLLIQLEKNSFRTLEFEELCIKKVVEHKL